MSVLLIGVTHRDLPLEVFERFGVTADDTPKLLAALTGRDPVSEAVVLATCNRTEIYVKAERFHGAFEDLRDLLVEHPDPQFAAEELVRAAVEAGGRDNVVVVVVVVVVDLDTDIGDDLSVTSPRDEADTAPRAPLSEKE